MKRTVGLVRRAGAMAALSLVVWAGTARAAPHVRKEIHGLAPEQVEALRKGVALMKTRAENDPTGWAYQANIHGFPITTPSICSEPTIAPQAAWATCQHGSFFFLAWHRMYLYYFERILRAAAQKATGDPKLEFALPYWDYEDTRYHDLPQPFRQPHDSSNALYVKERADDCNNGGVCVDAQTASDVEAMSRVPYCGCEQSSGCCAGCGADLYPDETFGGGYVAMPHHFAALYGELEQQPHNVVHNAIGGGVGWMSNPDCAARDPIFWLHHANIDRLWQVWLDQGGRVNPLDCASWKDTPFTFFDETGTQVSLTACQVLDMATQLDYVYENLPVQNVVLCTTQPPPARAAAPARERATLAESARQVVSLGNRPQTVELVVTAGAERRLEGFKRGEERGRLLLVVEGLRLVRSGANFRVYLNARPGAPRDPAGPHFVGHIGLFGHPGELEGVTRTFDVTAKVRELAKAGLWTERPQVAFERANREPRLEAKEPEAVFMTLVRVSLVAR